MNHNIINTIKNKLDIITVGRLNLNIPEKTKYYKKKGFTCSKCNGKLIKYTMEDYDDTRGEMIDNVWCLACELDDNEVHYLCKDCKYYYIACKKCSSEDEIILCQYLGFDGYIEHIKISYRVIDKKAIQKLKDRGIEKHLGNKYVKNCVNNENLLEFDVEHHKLNGSYHDICDTFQDIFQGFMFRPDDDDIMPYSVIDKNLEYFDISNCLPTGPDGGYNSYWRCNNCKYEEAITDK